MPRSNLPENVQRTLCNLLLRMTAFDETARPTMEEVAQTAERLLPASPGPTLTELVRGQWLPWIEEVPDSPTHEQPSIAEILPDEPDEAVFLDPEIAEPIQVDSTEETTGRWILAAADLEEASTDTASVRPDNRVTPTRVVRVDAPPLAAATKISTHRPWLSLLAAGAVGMLLGMGLAGIAVWWWW